MSLFQVEVNLTIDCSCPSVASKGLVLAFFRGFVLLERAFRSGPGFLSVRPKYRSHCLHAFSFRDVDSLSSLFVATVDVSNR